MAMFRFAVILVIAIACVQGDVKEKSKWVLLVFHWKHGQVHKIIVEQSGN